MISIGIVYALLTAVLTAFRSLLQKFAVDETDEYVAAWSYRALALIPLAIATPFFGIPEIHHSRFAIALVINGVLATVATILVTKAFKYEDMNVVVPLFALSPLPILVTGAVVLGEVPTALGVLGAFAIASGAYLLKYNQTEEADGVLEPLFILARSRGRS